MYENAALCTTCGGKCCKRMPGEMIPEDVCRMYPSATLHGSVNAALASGKIVVDWWEGDPRDISYDAEDYMDRCGYLRPRAYTDDPLSVKCGSWGGSCNFLGVEGCELSPEMRPLSCSLLEPQEDGSCLMHDGGGKKAAALAWLPYQDLVWGAVRTWFAERRK